jgi:transposase-like protein
MAAASTWSLLSDELPDCPVFDSVEHPAQVTVLAMNPTDDAKHCPTCGALEVVQAFERLGVKTFYCADCEYDWDEQEEEATTPDAPSPQ